MKLFQSYIFTTSFRNATAKKRPFFTKVLLNEKRKIHIKSLCLETILRVSSLLLLPLCPPMILTSTPNSRRVVLASQRQGLARFHFQMSWVVRGVLLRDRKTGIISRKTNIHHCTTLLPGSHLTQILLPGTTVVFLKNHPQGVSKSF